MPKQQSKITASRPSEKPSRKKIPPAPTLDSVLKLAAARQERAAKSALLAKRQKFIEQVKTMSDA